MLVREAGQRESIASEIGHLVEQHVRRELAGEKVAVMSRAERAARAERIRAEFTGRNRADLKARYGICESHLRRILKAQRSAG